MSSWGDTFTEQLRGDIFIDQQHAFQHSLTCPVRSGRIGATWRKRLSALCQAEPGPRGAMSENRLYVIYAPASFTAVTPPVSPASARLRGAPFRCASLDQYRSNPGKMNSSVS